MRKSYLFLSAYLLSASIAFAGDRGGHPSAPEAENKAAMAPQAPAKPWNWRDQESPWDPTHPHAYQNMIPEMQVHLKTLSGEGRMDIDCSSEWTLRQLKEALSKEIGVPADDIHLSTSGINDNDTLRQVGIKEHGSIIYALRVRPAQPE